MNPQYPESTFADTATRLPRRWAGRPDTPASMPLGELLKLLGVAPEVQPDAPPVPVKRLQLGTPLIHEGGSFDALYVVRSGSLKCFKTGEDGYEQVLSFVGSGDVLGFDALAGGRHPVGATTLEDTTVGVLAVAELARWRAAAPGLNRALQMALSRRLASAAETAALMAPVSAEACLARFLLWLADWMAQRGQSPRRLLLRMNRREIASLLGVSHETVSRSFTTLAEWGLLRIDIRELEILDPEGLRHCARSTRCLPAEPPATGRRRPVVSTVGTALGRAA